MTKDKEHHQIGWGMVKDSLPDMAAYVTMIVVMAVFRPPIFIVVGLVAIYIMVRLLIRRKFTIKKYIKSCAFIYGLLLAIYILKAFIGGLLAAVFVHIFLVGMIIYTRRAFIKQCDRQIKQQMDVIINKRRGGGDD